METIQLYSKSEVMTAVRKHLDTWRTGRPNVDQALRLEETEDFIIGIIASALPEKEKVMPFSQLYDSSHPMFI